MILAITIGVLTAGGVYLMMQRSMVRGVFGLTLVSHAANFILLSAGVGAWRVEPLSDRGDQSLAADPLPQARAHRHRHHPGRDDLHARPLRAGP